MSCPHCGSEDTARQATYCSLSCAQYARHSGGRDAVCNPDHGHRWDVHLQGGRWYYDCHHCPTVLEGPASTEELTTDCEGARHSEAA